MNNLNTLLTTLAMATATAATAQSLTLRLDQATADVSPTLYGLMTEEINYSYEGGLYAQLVRNASFRDDKNGKRPNPWTPWQSGGPSYWSIADSTLATVRREEKGGYNRANPARIVWNAKAGATLVNDGYWGFPIQPNEQYKGAIIAKTHTDNLNTVKVSLVSIDGKTVYATATINDLTSHWQKHEFTLTVAKDVLPTKDAHLQITAMADGEYELSKVTLFPETFNSRENGLRKDLMEMMCEMHPKFLRFPGGNYLEGNDFQNRFDWKRTVGNPDERPGHLSPWGYRSSDGMGLLEFLTWAEDVGAEPVLGLFAGYVLSGDHLTADYIDPFVEEALEEIEYVMGGTDTRWGAQRARDGHPAPFSLHYVEIGNEDFFDYSGSYPGRYKKFYEAIKARYPQLEIISTIDARQMKEWAEQTGVEDVKLDIVDEHYYRSTVGMYRAAHQYDSYDRQGPRIFCGEWAAREGKPTTNLNAALGDAAWMTGMERNSDIVFAHCYAPLFVNVSPGGMQWESDLIGYDALTAYGSPSYYAQCMFAQNVGNKIVPVGELSLPKMTINGETLDQLYYSATTDTRSGKSYLKVVNGGETPVTVTINVTGGKVRKKGTKTTLTSKNTDDTNTIDNPKNVVPVTSQFKAGKKFQLLLVPKSINVFSL